MKAIQWTIFIDMLGFSDLNRKVSNDVEARELIEFMSTNLDTLKGYEKNVSKAYGDGSVFNLYEYYEIKHAFISDSIVLTFKPREVAREKNPRKVLMHSANALMLISMRLQSLMVKCIIEKGIIFRGGISSEFCDIKESFAVGVGLSAAHYAESKLAVYPRIVFSEDVLRRTDLLKMLRKLYSAMYGEPSLLASDKTTTYLNLINFLIAFANPSVPSNASYISKTKDIGIFLENRRVAELFLMAQKDVVERWIKHLLERYKKSIGMPRERKNIRRVIRKYFWLRKHHNHSIRGRGYDAFLI